MQITAGIIIVDYNKNEIYAGRIKDSSGIYTQLPVFVQGNDEVNPDSLKFNFDTKIAQDLFDDLYTPKAIATIQKLIQSPTDNIESELEKRKSLSCIGVRSQAKRSPAC